MTGPGVGDDVSLGETGNAGLYVVLGALYERAGRIEDAMRAYEMATRIDPNQVIAKNNLAWLLAEHGGGDEATRSAGSC